MIKTQHFAHQLVRVFVKSTHKFEDSDNPVDVMIHTAKLAGDGGDKIKIMMENGQIFLLEISMLHKDR
jgi:hypothetical protein